MAEVFRILDAASRETISNPMEIAVRQNQTVHLSMNVTLLRRDGREIPIEDCVSPIHDREGQATGAVIVFRDVSAARAMAQQMSHWEGHAEPVLVLPSAQITCVLASTGLKSPACAVVRLLARRAVISKPYAFFVESVIW